MGFSANSDYAKVLKRIVVNMLENHIQSSHIQLITAMVPLRDTSNTSIRVLWALSDTYARVSIILKKILA